MTEKKHTSILEKIRSVASITSVIFTILITIGGYVYFTGKNMSHLESAVKQLTINQEKQEKRLELVEANNIEQKLFQREIIVTLKQIEKKMDQINN